MVKEVTKKGKKYFQCEECGFFFEKKILAEKCEKFCKKYKSCNLELTKFSVKI